MPEPLFHPSLMFHLDSLVPPRDPVLREMEDYALETRFPIVGPAAGYFLYQLARMTGARQVFELGSGYGYSTAWFARAVRENGGGVVHHAVWDQELSDRAKHYLERLGYSDLVRYHVGEAVGILKETSGPFDLVFNDIDKQGYPGSLLVIKEKLRKGGVLVLDNMLWHGAIFDSSDHSPNTRGIHITTAMLAHDPDFITSLLPIRDGLMMAFRT